MANSNINDTSIELISQDGPLPMNIMMQEGVKALTKILSDHLQDGTSFEDDSRSMQVVFKNMQGVINESTNDSESKKIIELENEDKSVSTEQFVIRNQQNKADSEEYVSDPDLHLNGDDGELVFDYGSEIITDNPEELGERLSQMIESVIPNGFPKDKGGMLHAVLNGDELKITEEDSTNTTSYLDNYDTPNNIEGNYQRNINPSEHLDKVDASISHIHKTHHNHGYDSYNNQSSNRVKYKNYNYHDYKYYPINEKKQSTPDFSVLLSNEAHLCMFCEYYMVFGEPPKNMIKWYNKIHGYNCVSPHSKN
ncbi:hypothetical protein TPHA_0F02200 [Tetrapisispora phaffii CBS 4417]|uniref:Protein IBD2 n=1 Tax=Tetrapisispora phaffii (strain ATCC 24235 / CBS 4417 / NBRC 1672 / NRRL Y-8282 / UCD 70-5) TaxID=1071381 RepID=G8BVC0_TETPH|nr:hypothetical protein TPHA_0F02200 [Tetrapisispora phaffii CBS 4417]CCE63702.1 hypothetical protein TPHA_0F02200 [Tetrapisispora phaffii CBS 4417]